MAQKRRFLDVWITEGNTVYREVPFAVVTDWIQQGRLLADDKLRPSGTAEWFAIGGSPAFAAYMPKVEEHRAEDQAEALEPVEVDFAWKRKEDEDDDVDMIPLIDISLVLLIFFMMTAAVGAELFNITTPVAQHKTVELSEDMKLWVGIEHKGSVTDPKDHPWYSFGLKDDILIKPTESFAVFSQLLRDELEKQLTDRGKNLQKANALIRIRLRADHALPIEIIKNTSVELKNIENRLRSAKFPNVQISIYGQVSDPQAKK
jgi:biopolymer transport protein ExbD